jgi:hypothetical protein
MQLLFFLCFLHLRNKFMLIMDTNNSPIHTFPSEWVSPKTNLHRISLHASSDCTKTPSSRAFTSHASNCNCRQSQNKTGKKKTKKTSQSMSIRTSQFLVTDLSFFFRKSVVLYDKPCIHLQICVQVCVCVCAPCSIDTWGLIYAVLRRRYLKVQSIQICPTNPFRK